MRFHIESTEPVMPFVGLPNVSGNTVAYLSELNLKDCRIRVLPLLLYGGVVQVNNRKYLNIRKYLIPSTLSTENY